MNMLFEVFTKVLMNDAGTKGTTATNPPKPSTGTPATNPPKQ